MSEKRTSDNRNYGGSTPLAAEHARRRRKRKRGPSRAVRYFAAILVIILVFFVAYSIGSWLIKNALTPNTPDEDEVSDDPVITLQKRLDELTNENKLLSEEIKELQSKIDRYNTLYGPLDAFSDEGGADSSASASSPSEGAASQGGQSSAQGSSSDNSSADSSQSSAPGAEEI